MTVAFVGFGNLGAPRADRVVTLAARDLNSAAVRKAQARNPALMPRRRPPRAAGRGSLARMAGGPPPRR